MIKFQLYVSSMNLLTRIDNSVLLRISYVALSLIGDINFDINFDVTLFVHWIDIIFPLELISNLWGDTLRLCSSLNFLSTIYHTLIFSLQ